MTVRELFDAINTDYPAIEIIDYEHNIIYSKKENTIIVRLDKDLWNSEVDWIYKIDSQEVSIRVDIGRV